MLTILLTLLSFGLIISPVRAESSNLSVRLEEPKTPSRIKEIEIKYVALDIQGRGVYCKLSLKKVQQMVVLFNSVLKLYQGSMVIHLIVL